MTMSVGGGGHAEMIAALEAMVRELADRLAVLERAVARISPPPRPVS